MASNMAAGEFFIRQGTEKLFERKAAVEDWFGVKLRVERADKACAWVYIEEGSPENVALARKYIQSLCEAEYSQTKSVSPKLYEILRRSPGFIEKECAAAVEFHPQNTVVLRGADELVPVIAVSIIEEKEKGISESMTTFPAAAPVEPAQQLPRPLFDFARRLGFSPEDIDLVVRKYGPAINQDKLLKELMQCTPRSTADRRPQQLSSSLGRRGPTSTSDGLILSRGCGRSPPRTTSFAALEVGGGVPVTASTDVILRRGCGRSPLRGTAGPTSVEADSSGEDVAANQLRPVIIDGSNVAMEHGNQQVFSCWGIQICVDWFRQRGHTDITVFVPSWRVDVVRPDITNQEVLRELNRAGVLKFTPCKTSGNRQFVCYDDRFILDLATNTGGIVVSNDRFRDLQRESAQWTEVIEERVLRYTFAKDRFMPPSDPLGRLGPCLDDFLRKGTATHPRICPYINNCTYGLQCKYYHPERDEQRVSAQRHGSVDGHELVQPHSGELYGLQRYPPVLPGYNFGAHDRVDGHDSVKDDFYDKYYKLKEIFPQVPGEDIKKLIRKFPQEDPRRLTERLI